ncbi:uncharacterized protein LOC119857909 [Dermochelys coriacea]|uniref:uncharacterized protein LOC119857909 n=1 Tax=Dermochelys coriacea TaxID=27794 RepID=UPI001CA95952|nr:uncharacterized protein LOC119857909 [Dermochelys coriacea]
MQWPGADGRHSQTGNNGQISTERGISHRPDGGILHHWQSVNCSGASPPDSSALAQPDPERGACPRGWGWGLRCRGWGLQAGRLLAGPGPLALGQSQPMAAPLSCSRTAAPEQRVPGWVMAVVTLGLVTLLCAVLIHWGLPLISAEGFHIGCRRGNGRALGLHAPARPSLPAGGERRAQTVMRKNGGFWVERCDEVGDFLGFFHWFACRGLSFPGCYGFNEGRGEGVCGHRGPARELGTPANGADNGDPSDWQPGDPEAQPGQASGGTVGCEERTPVTCPAGSSWEAGGARGWREGAACRKGLDVLG